MLINLTNHPFEKWSIDQRRNAMELYQEIVDLPFPVVDPLGDENYIHELVEVYFRKVLDLQKNNTDTTFIVHIMGEMNFTVAIVKRLQLQGICCVASTTQRIVEMLPNGEKNALFQFQKFRRYE